MKPKWILAIMVVAFGYAMYKKSSTSEPPPTAASIDLSANDSTARPETAASATTVDLGKVWPPLIEGVAASATSTVNYYIVLDGSGSMLSRECGGGGTKMEAALDAVKHFIETAPADANVGLAAFDRRAVSERVALGVDNRETLRDALRNIRAGSGTPLRSTIKIGYDRLTDQARTQLGYGEYHLVVVTDGHADPYSEDPTLVVNDILASSPVVLHTVGFCIAANHVLNQQGRTYYASATSPQELQDSLQAVLAEAPAFDAAKFN